MKINISRPLQRISKLLQREDSLAKTLKHRALATVCASTLVLTGCEKTEDYSAVASTPPPAGYFDYTNESSTAKKATSDYLDNTQSLLLLSSNSDTALQLLSRVHSNLFQLKLNQGTLLTEVEGLSSKFLQVERSMADLGSRIDRNNRIVIVSNVITLPVPGDIPSTVAQPQPVPAPAPLLPHSQQPAQAITGTPVSAEMLMPMPATTLTPSYRHPRQEGESIIKEILNRRDEGPIRKDVITYAANIILQNKRVTERNVTNVLGKMCKELDISKKYYENLTESDTVRRIVAAYAAKEAPRNSLGKYKKPSWLHLGSNPWKGLDEDTMNMLLRFGDPILQGIRDQQEEEKLYFKRLKTKRHLDTPIPFTVQ